MTPIAERTRSIQRWVFWLGVALLVGAAVIYLLVWLGPDLIARHDIGNVTGPLRVLRLQQARDAARGRLLTLGTGLFAAGALLFTGRNFTLSRRAVELTRRTVDLTEQGQVTDRYTKAIEQLGSDKLDVRIGGIYALERVTHDSERDHPTVMEVLTAFIREHSPEPWPPADDEPSLMKWRALRRPTSRAGSTTAKTASWRTSGAHGPERTTRPDVQAAVTVVGRRDPKLDRQPVDLHAATLTRANLTGADLTDAKLDGAEFTGAEFTGANLTGARLYSAALTGAALTDADLTDAKLGRANLTGAFLTRADLAGANLRRAALPRAKFPGANLTGADLTDAKLGGAEFIGADLTGADLTGADLTGADLTIAKLTGATLTSATLTGASLFMADLTDADLTDADLTDARWPRTGAAPTGWQRDTDSGRLMRADTDSDGAATV